MQGVDIEKSPVFSLPGFNGLAAKSPTTRRRQQDIKPNKPVNNVRKRRGEKA